MRIRTLLASSSVLSTALILSMAATLAFVYSLDRRGKEGLALANEIRTTVFERIVLRDEYFNRWEDRPKAQWKARTELLLSQLDRARALFPKEIDAESLRGMREDTEKTVAIFVKLTEAGAAAREAPWNISSEYWRNLYSQILIASYFLRDSATRLIERREIEIASLNRTENALLIGSLGIVFLLIFINGIWISQVLSRGIKRLFAGTSNLAEGNLDSRFAIDSDDEIADVMNVINRMAERLQGAFTSIRNLEAESLRRTRAEEEAQRALGENQTLLKELQHRAKNSFSMILSMINMTASSIDNAGIQEVLDDLSLRVGAVSEFYSLLYASGSPADLRLDEYCRRVASPLAELSRNVDLRLELNYVMMPAKGMVSVGLILTELVTNAIKHAFPEGRAGTITVALGNGINVAILEVRDDGIGLPAGFDRDQRSGMGLSLVRALCDQVDASFSMQADARGTRCVVAIPLDVPSSAQNATTAPEDEGTAPPNEGTAPPNEGTA